MGLAQGSKDVLAYSEFSSQPKLGFQTIESDRYGAFYYVPPDYTPEKEWPLVVVLVSDEGAKGKVAIETWLSEIKKQNVIALFITYLEPRDVPFVLDVRMLKRVREFESLFQVDRRRVLLTGFGSAAHYAFYLVVRYSDYFSAAALVAGTPEGFLNPYLMAGDENGKSKHYLIVAGDQDKTLNRERLSVVRYEFETNGYRLEMKELKGLGHQVQPEYSKEALNWFLGLPAPEVVPSNASWSPINYLPSFVRGIFKN